MAEQPGLRLGPGLWFPLDAITQTIALLAVKRWGKSNAAAVMAEEMFEAALPWVGIDPKGDWWGLRSSADGKSPGLPIPIFGGLHGDMPLLPESGSLMAELIVEQNLTCVLDVSQFSKTARMRFLADFAERLFRLHQADPQPRHLFLEEAQVYLPQRVMAEQARCVGAFTTLVAQGGSFGLGITLLTQRSAVLNKDVLSEIEALIAGRSTSPQDRKAIRDWMEHHAIASEIVESLPGLADGEAWVSSSSWLPKHGQPNIQRERFRQRRTFDSGATPVVGQRRKVATLADIDLGALQGRMEAVVEKAAQDDPKALRRKVAELQRQLRQGDTPEVQRYARMAESLQAENEGLRRQLAGAQAREPERIEVPVLQPGEIAALEQSIAAMKDVTAPLELALTRAAKSAAVPVPPRPVPPTVAAVTPPAPREPRPASDAPASLGRAHKAILSVLAQFPEGRTKQQVAILTGYSVKGGGFNNALGALRTMALIEGRDHMVITGAGMAAIGDEWEPLPEGAELLEHWVAQLPRAEGLILRVLAEAWPRPVAKADVAEQTGYTVTGGGFNNALGKLRTLQLISGSAELVADETVAQHAQGGIHA